MESLNEWLKSTFRGPVPVLTGSFQYILSIAVSVISASTIFLIGGLRFDIILTLTFGIVLGIATQICLALFIPKFYGKILHDSEMDDMLKNIFRKIEPVGAFEIWISNSTSMFITTHISLFAKSIVISETMLNSMKKLPEKAEIVLAERVLELNSMVQYVNLVCTTAVFTILWYYYLYILMPFLFLPTVVLTIFGGLLIYLFGGLFVLLVFFREITWRRSNAFEIVRDVYQVQLGVAEKCLLENRELSQIETEELLILLRHLEEKKRSKRRVSISIIASGFSFLLSSLLLNVIYLFIDSTLFMILLGPILLLPVCVSLISTQLLIKRFDDRAIDRLYRKFEQKTELKWID